MEQLWLLEVLSSDIQKNRRAEKAHVAAPLIPGFLDVSVPWLAMT